VIVSAAKIKKKSLGKCSRLNLAIHKFRVTKPTKLISIHLYHLKILSLRFLISQQRSHAFIEGLYPCA